MQMVMQAKPKFAIIAKKSGSGLFGCLVRPIKRGEGAGHLVTSYSPSHSEALSHPSLGSLPPLPQPEPLPIVAEPCASTVPCLTEPHHHRHDLVRTSRACTTIEPLVTAAVASAEPSLCCCYTVCASTASSVALCPWPS